MKIRDLQQVFQKELHSTFAKEEIDSFFYMLLEAFSDLSRLDLALDTNMSITVKEQEPFFNALNELKQHKPIQYILGSTVFFDLVFDVDENVLIPRPETEELVAWILKEKDELNSEAVKILDIGTGSGCIAIALANNLPKAQIFAMDVSPNALHIAKQNAVKNNVQVKFIEADVLGIKTLENKFDIIVSNPPYVRVKEKKLMTSNVLNFEPELALFVTDEDPLLFYKAICQLASKHLNINGKLYFEINEYLGVKMTTLLEANGFRKVQLRKDISGKDRMILAIK